MFVQLIAGDSERIGFLEVSSDEANKLKPLFIEVGVIMVPVAQPDSLVRQNPLAALATVASWTPTIIETTKVAIKHAPKVAKKAKALAKKAQKAAKFVKKHKETVESAIATGKRLKGEASKLQRTLRKRREETK